MHMCSMFSDRPQRLWNLASLRRLMTNIVQPNSVILLSVRNVFVLQCFIKKMVPSQFGIDSPIPRVLKYLMLMIEMHEKVQLLRICLGQDKRFSQALVLKRTLTDAFLMCQGRGTFASNKTLYCQTYEP